MASWGTFIFKSAHMNRCSVQLKWTLEVVKLQQLLFILFLKNCNKIIKVELNKHYLK